jgi:uncharacterized protein YegJ (DUF2314 family)
MKRIWGNIWLLIISLLLGCSTDKSKQDEWDKQNMRDIYLSDPKVSKAFAMTQDSLSLFLEQFKAHSNDSTYQFYIKSKYEEDGHIEHMWSIPLEALDQKLKCVLDNQPRDLQNIQVGDTVLIDLSSIDDFDVTHNGVLLMGNYLQK